MARAFIGIGSNIDPERNIARSLRLLRQKARVIGVSTVYLTGPEGGRREQPSYFNCVVAIETDLPPSELKQEVLSWIEQQLGRKRSGDRFSSRTCDLDLLLYGDDPPGSSSDRPALSGTRSSGVAA
jgi:2-amino-4-hydroxy-6-hydroxymethyldihydropteridine diphosphokinase